MTSSVYRFTKSILLLLISFALSFHLAAQNTTRLSYAISNDLNVYEEPDTNSKLIGRLIYDEAIITEVGSEKSAVGGSWVKIVSPFEGYFFRSSSSTTTTGSSSNQTEESYFKTFRKAGTLAPTAESGGTSSESPEEMGEEMESEGFFSRFFKGLFGDESASQMAASPAGSETTGTAEKKKNTGMFANFSNGQEKITLGVGLGLYNVPEEKGFKTTSFPLDIHLEIEGLHKVLSKFRFGINMIKAEDGDYTTDTTSLYGVYRIKTDRIKIDNVGVRGFVGLAYMTSSISGDASGSSQGIGIVFGGGGTYAIDQNMRIGGQAIYFSNQANFGSVKRYIGSTQFQLTGSYQF